LFYLPPPQFVTGTVWSPSDSINCEFADKWRSEGQKLNIQTSCSDSLSREFTFELVTDFGYAQPIISLGTDTSWVHPGWNWVWEKCESESKCIEELCDIGWLECNIY